MTTRNLLALATVLLLGAGNVVAAPKTWQTYPMPPKIKAADPMRINPGVTIPFKPERFTWKVAAPKNEPKITVVPVFSFAGGRMSKIGNVDLGTPLTLDEVRQAGRTHYYTLKFTPPGGTETTAWINGNYVVPTSLASDK